jgi:hypothetical protein
MTSEEFAVVVSVLESGFGHQLSATQQEVWFRTLSLLPGEAVQQAAASMCRDWPHDRRPWASDLYQRAREFVRVASVPLWALPEPSREPLQAQARELLSAMGAGGEPGPNAVPIDVAVEIIAEKIRGGADRPLTAAEVYGPRGVMAAIAGRGPHTELWLTLRDRLPHTVEGVA